MVTAERQGPQASAWRERDGYAGPWLSYPHRPSVGTDPTTLLALIKTGLLVAVLAAQGPDTATVRLHISRMTCGSCPTTARLALKRLTGIYGATVTLDDSLGVVRYDPRRVTPAQIAAHLTKLTGFGAAILP